MKNKFQNNIIYRLLILVKNRSTSGFRSFYEAIGFMSLLIPPLNLIFSKLFSKVDVKKNSTYKIFLFNMLNIGIGWGSLRYMKPEIKSHLGLAFNNYQIKKRNLKTYEKKEFKDNSKLLDDIKSNGYTKLGNFFNDKETLSVKDYFKNSSFYTSQVPEQGHKIDEGFLIKESYTQSRYRSVEPEISLSCDLISDFLKNDKLTDFLKIYFGFSPDLHNINTFATMPFNFSHHVMKGHRDYDHFYGITVFISWTKTSKDNGATMYLKGSNALNNIKEKEYTSIDSNPGDVYLLDTFGMHYGNPLVKDIRLATWLRYGTVPNYSYLINKPFFINTETF